MAERAYGLLAEFESPEALTAAAKKAREAGYRRLDAFTPFPIEGLARTLRLPRPKISWVGLIGGCSGCGFAFLMQCYTNYDFPLNVGGRPLYAFSAFAVVMFELTILFSALSMIVAMLWQNGLPRLNYPLFAAEALSSRQQRPLLPLRRGRRRKVRRGSDVRLSPGSWARPRWSSVGR